MTEKRCTKCLTVKSLDYFHCDKRKLSGRMEQCKVCKKAYVRSRYDPQKELSYNQTRRASAAEYSRNWRLLSTEQKATIKRERQEKIDKEGLLKKEAIVLAKAESLAKKESAKILKAEKKVADKIASAQLKILRKKERTLAYILKFHTDPLFKIKELLRQRAIKVFKRNNWSRDRCSSELLGTDLETVRTHIENLFEPGMSWINHGEWHIDHRTPLDTAKTIEEVYPLFHYKNLQPLWALDNMRKYNKIISACQ